MRIFLFILENNIIPIFILIGLGFILSKKFDLDVFTLGKLNFYIFVPGFIFFNLYTTDLSLNMLKILFYCIVYQLFNDLLARAIAKVKNYDLGQTNAFKNTIMFNNSGNIGVPLITLIFSSAPFVINGKTPYLNDPLAVQIMVLVFMNVSMNTIGFYNAGRANMSAGKSIHKIFTMPSIYAVPAALLIKYINVDITGTPLWTAVGYIKGGLISMALITLGVQLSKTKFNFKDINVNMAAFTRLLVGPALAFVLIHIFGFYGVIAQTVFISYSVPTAVNTALIAAECDNNPDFASQEVMVSTLFSAVTLTSAIYIARIIFPV